MLGEIRNTICNRNHPEIPRTGFIHGRPHAVGVIAARQDYGGHIEFTQMGFKRRAVERSPAGLIAVLLARPQCLQATTHQELIIRLGSIVGQQLGRYTPAFTTRQEKLFAGGQSIPPAQFSILAVRAIQAQYMNDRPGSLPERCAQFGYACHLC